MAFAAALATSGYERITTAEEAEVVVVGLDQQARYEQLAEAALAIQADKPWIATNPDRSVPSERGDLPGAGALLALLTAVDRTPTVCHRQTRRRHVRTCPGSPERPPG